MKRVAAEKSPHPHPASAYSAVPLYGLACVFRAGGNETTGGRKQRRNYRLVKPQEQDKNSSHRLRLLACERWSRSSLLTRARILWNSSRGASTLTASRARRALITQSYFNFVPSIDASLWWNVSRSSRLERFRLTALPTALREAVMPSL